MVTKQSPWIVAGIDSAIVTPEILEACLRETEIQEATTIANRRRRDEWIAGRIAAKYAFLCEEESIESAEPGALHLRMLGGADLAAFGVEDYRAVAVTRNHAPGGGPARVGWLCGADSVQVAISHSAGIACASVGTMGVQALDVETPEPRVPEFYLQTFNGRERDWVNHWAGACGFHSEWLYTLLWSTKECLLKTPHFAGLSLWNMPVLEIDIRSGIEQLAGIDDSTECSGAFVSLEASTFCGPFRLAVAGSSRLIVTAVTGIDSDLSMRRVIQTTIAHAANTGQNSVDAPLPAAPVNVYGRNL